MEHLTYEEILEATKGKFLEKHDSYGVYSVCTDSRKIEHGCLFVPLEGERFDGHNYIEDAFKAGANAALTHKVIGNEHKMTLIHVDNTSKALRDLAAYYLAKFDIPVTAVTGSVGKTSTKDMIACVLAQKFKVLKTQGNLNNEIGLPLSVLNLASDYNAAIFEMGMSGFGEISRLTSIVKPNIAVITGIGVSHIEKLGTRENILQAKLEILEGLKNGGLLILNGDDDLLNSVKPDSRKRVVFFGTGEFCEYRATNINTYGEEGTSFDILVAGCRYKIIIPAPGIHNVYNALAAVAVGVELGLGITEIIKGISEFRTGKMRMEIIHSDGFTIINDAYNASPQSVEAAVKVLAGMNGRTGRRIAVLGDMLELGEWADEAHKETGRVAFLAGVDILVTVGSLARKYSEGAIFAGMPEEKVFRFENCEKALEYLQSIIGAGDSVLIKGSRGMAMESIAEKLKVHKIF